MAAVRCCFAVGGGGSGKLEPEARHHVPNPGTKFCVIRVTDLELAARRGEVYFKKRLEANGADASTVARGVQPLIVYDLDRDGLPEIVLGG